MIEVKVYSRPDCHLCEKAINDLVSLQTQIPHQLTIIDVDQSVELRKKYGFEVPVVEIGPYTIKAPITLQDLQITLFAAQQRVDQIEAIDRSIEAGDIQLKVNWTNTDRITLWMSKHYLALFNIFVSAYLGFALLAPVLMNAGFLRPANILYRMYGVVCHQLAFRSFFLFGEQIAYPRAIANVENHLSYESAIGLDSDDLWSAREYIGNEAVGYKIALCERDLAIYTGILIFGLIFPLFRRRIPALSWVLWILIGIVPIGIDGLSQLLSQPPLNFFSLRESTPLIRTLTGFLFGFATAWFGYPMVEESMSQTISYMEHKLKRSKNLGC
jgi:uncharacterized membrane protein